VAAVWESVSRFVEKQMANKKVCVYRSFFIPSNSNLNIRMVK
jgi:hypothetical protein